MSQRRSQRIPRVICSKLPAPQVPVQVDEEEAAHLQQALRVRPGDAVIAIDGKGSEIPGQVFIREKKLWIETQETKATRQIAPSIETTPLILEMAIIKGDAMSWVIEKAVELGVQKIIPIECDHGVVEVSKKGAEHFVERWQRIADQSLKQCERLNRLTIESPRSFGEALRLTGSTRLIAVEPSLELRNKDSKPPQTLPHALGALAPSSAPIHLMIGPEGGFSAAEADAMRAEIAMGKAIPVSLGPLVLRAETAAIFAMSVALGARIS